MDFSDDDDCQDAMCAVINSMLECPPDFIVADDGDVPDIHDDFFDDDEMTDAAQFGSCFMECFAVGGGCMNSLSNKCDDMLNATLSGWGVDDPNAFCEIIVDDPPGDDCTSAQTDDECMDDEDDDEDFDVDEICDTECLYRLFDNMILAFTVCDEEDMGLFGDDSDDPYADDTYDDDEMPPAAVLNQMCAKNSDGDYCFELFEDLGDDDDGSGDDDDDGNPCEDIEANDFEPTVWCNKFDDWGCCLGVLMSFGMPACVPSE